MFELYQMTLSHCTLQLSRRAVKKTQKFKYLGYGGVLHAVFGITQLSISIPLHYSFTRD